MLSFLERFQLKTYPFIEGTVNFYGIHEPAQGCYFNASLHVEI